MNKCVSLYRAASLVFSLVLAAGLCFPATGYSETRTTDIIAGATVEERGISPQSCPSIEAARALVMDAQGNVYFERNADEPCHIASVTKVMTAVVALDNAPLDASVVVSEDAASVGESSAELEEGDIMPLSEALKALLWPSGNDAAIAIAETVGGILLINAGQDASNAGICRQAFVNAMNEKSVELGLSGSLWANPHGLDDGEFTADMHCTARDVAKLAAYAMSKEEIRAITSQPGGTVTVSREGVATDLYLESTDQLLGVYEGTEGVKTGFTDEAGYCFAGACNRGGVELFSAVLGCSTEEQRFEDTTILWDWVYAHRIDYRLVQASQNTRVATGADVPLVARVACKAWTDKTVRATVSDPSATITVFDLLGNVSSEAEFIEPEGSVSAGDKVGEVVYYQHNNEVARMDLIATESVDAPGLLDSIVVWWQRFIGGFSGDACVATSYLEDDMPLINDKRA